MAPGSGGSTEPAREPGMLPPARRARKRITFGGSPNGIRRIRYEWTGPAGESIPGFPVQPTGYSWEK